MLKRYMLRAGIAVAMAAAAVMLSGRVAGNMDAGGPGRLEDAVREAAAACYSTEGAYPDSVDHLVDRYGLRPDGRYTIHYTIFASNMPPEVHVTEKAPDGR